MTAPQAKGAQTEVKGGTGSSPAASNDLDQILSEIDGLQKEMNAVEAKAQESVPTASAAAKQKEATLPPKPAVKPAIAAVPSDR
jgi:hypothetical protein